MLTNIDVLQEIRQKVLRRILSLIDDVLGLDNEYLWRLHEDEQGITGDDVRHFIY